MTYAHPAFCWLDDRGCIRAAGPDAPAFLQAQLTQQIAALPAGRSALAAWLDARGRVRAVFDVLPVDDGFVLVTSADLVEQLVGQLRMYVLRSKVEIDALTGHRVAALVGDSSPWLEAQGVALDGAPRSIAAAGSFVCWRLARDKVRAAGPGAELAAALTGLALADPATADAAEIALGLPAVSAAMAQHYVPQMLNLDRLGAIAFDKGCYPGQEIVARTHNLGTVKRRLMRFGAAAGPTPAPGSAVVDAGGEAIGEVLRGAPSDDGVELLAVVPLASREQPLALAEDGRRLTLRPLPAEGSPPT